MNMYDASGRPRVDHTYRDFSRYLDGGGKVEKHKKSGANFPAKLHKMLSDPRWSHIIMWMPHGRAWKILNKELLMTDAVPTYFVQTKFESFTRQLSGWGFKRLHQSGPDFGCYYNERFLRGIPLLTGVMRRVNTRRGKPTPFPEGEPDFNFISRSYPLPPPSASDENSSTPAAAGSAAADVKPASQYVQSTMARTDQAHSSATSLAAAVTMPPSTSMPHFHSNEMASWSDVQYPWPSSTRDSSSMSSAASATISSSSMSFRPIVQSPAAPSGRGSLTSSSASIPAAASSRMNYPPSAYQMANTTNAQTMRAYSAQNLTIPSTQEYSSTSLASTAAALPAHMNYPPSYQTTSMPDVQNLSMPPSDVHSSSAHARLSEFPVTVASTAMNYDQPPYQIPCNVQRSNISHHGYGDAPMYSNYPPNSYPPSSYAPNSSMPLYCNNHPHFGARYDQYSTQPRPYQPDHSQQDESITATSSAGQQENEDHAQDSNQEGTFEEDMDEFLKRFEF